MAYSRRQFEDIEDDVESDFADMIDLLLSILTTKDGDFVTLAGDTPAKTRWRVGRMASRWKGELENLHADSQQVIDNCMRRARKKFGTAREVELQQAAKHVQYINRLNPGYREVRRLVNIVWPLHGMTLVKRLRGEGRVKTAGVIGQRGGAIVNKMLERYISGEVEIPQLSSLQSTETKQLTEPIRPTPTPETKRTRKKLSKEEVSELLQSGTEFEMAGDGTIIPVKSEEEELVEIVDELKTEIEISDLDIDDSDEEFEDYEPSSALTDIPEVPDEDEEDLSEEDIADALELGGE